MHNSRDVFVRRMFPSWVGALSCALWVAVSFAACAVDDRVLSASDGDARLDGSVDGDARDRASGRDAQLTCAPGSACVPSNPCHDGEQVCAADGGSTCRDKQKSKLNGAPCDTGSVCRNGECVTCAEGTACAIAGNPCRVGKIDCASGSGVCVESDNAAVGTACGGSMVCESGQCVACVSGRPCSPVNRCHAGALDCSGPAPVCVDKASNVTPGTPCGQDAVCNSTGACVPCHPGADCSVAGKACRAGTTACNTGSPICVESGNALEGAECGPNMSCSGGACVACRPGAACVPTNRCHAGRAVCSPTVGCIDTGEPVANGSACGADLVCSDGSCIACAAGKPCQTATPCRAGITACSTGVASCVESGVQPNGTACGTGQVCANGTCVDCQPGAACAPANPCHGGQLSCAAGAATCSDDGAALPDGTRCGSDLVCRAGQCVTCKANTVCQAANTCKTGVGSCATGSLACVDGVNKAAGETCDSGMVCNGSGACVACHDGDACAPGNACHAGVLSCSSGAPVCTDIGKALSNGAPCGKNLVCAAGACTACIEGLACAVSSPCAIGTTSCASGTSVCRETGKKAAGSTCGTGMVCSALGDCVGCNEGAACQPANACHQGTYACDTGAAVCADSARPSPDGKSCGAGLVCRAGVCAACQEGTPCQPTNPCKTGTSSCATGTSACRESGNAPAGQPCGLAQSCAAGVKSTAALCDRSGVCAAPVKTTCPSGCNAAGTDCLSCASGQTACAGACCAAGQGCCSNRCVSLATATNCGTCGHDCTASAHLGSTSLVTCSNGGCVVPQAACAPGFANCAPPANDVDGCETATTTTTNCGGCNIGCSIPNATASCATGTCVLAGCAAASHQCENTCYPDTDPTHCGSGCVDCRWLDDAIVCSGGACKCASGGTELHCPGVPTTLAACAAWNFNSGTSEGWESLRVLHDAWTGTTISNPRASPGVKALALGFNNGDATDKTEIWVIQQLCTEPVSLASRTLTARIFMESAAGSNLKAMDGYLEVINSGVAAPGSCTFGTTISGQWVTIACPLAAPAMATALNLVLRVFTPWVGTIYVDDMALE